MQQSTPCSLDYSLAVLETTASRQVLGAAVGGGREEGKHEGEGGSSEVRTL